MKRAIRSRVVIEDHGKLIRRHPHVLGGSRLLPPDRPSTGGRGLRSGEEPRAPGALRIDPACRRAGAYKVQQSAAALGFDWPSLRGGEMREEPGAERCISQRGGGQNRRRIWRLAICRRQRGPFFKDKSGAGFGESPAKIHGSLCLYCGESGLEPAAVQQLFVGGAGPLVGRGQGGGKNN